jgi:hypothetical protein
MADPTAGDESGVPPGREYPGTPGWLKVSGMVFIGLVVLVLLVLVVGTALGLHTPMGPMGPGHGR